MKKIISTIIVMLFIASSLAHAHSGRTDKDGCHNDRKAGTYHCH